MRDVIIAVGLVLAFATFVTAHFALSFRIARRVRAWRGLAALVVPPLAPIFGLRAGFRKNSALWLGAVLLYLAALIAAKATS